MWLVANSVVKKSINPDCDTRLKVVYLNSENTFLLQNIIAENKKKFIKKIAVTHKNQENRYEKTLLIKKGWAESAFEAQFACCTVIFYVFNN